MPIRKHNNNLIIPLFLASDIYSRNNCLTSKRSFKRFEKGAIFTELPHLRRLSIDKPLLLSSSLFQNYEIKNPNTVAKLYSTLPNHPRRFQDFHIPPPPRTIGRKRYRK
ncbi:hypothetical protein CEXT_418771 [Caerostris extrusa]|uniref:Ribosomal protein S18 n=1 Tax=Caerostris extrusa TaxID=172846 RepID=A0AAV4TAE8_CAEEX|nr:hypothetical protein CEXT_418771 [Caerostris extrusa]